MRVRSDPPRLSARPPERAAHPGGEILAAAFEIVVLVEAGGGRGQQHRVAGLRFGHGVSDAFIDDYAGRTDLTGCLIYGFFSKGHLRAAAELRKLGDTWGREAEAAFSVERTFQDQGLGTELMGRVIRSARNRGVQLLYMSCLAENRKMQRIASKHEAVLRYELGEVVGEIVPNSANYASLMVEALEDRMAFMFAVLDLKKRIASSAA